MEIILYILGVIYVLSAVEFIRIVVVESFDVKYEYTYWKFLYSMIIASYLSLTVLW